MLTAEGADGFHALDADALVAMLDSAGIRRATVLSVAYLYGAANRSVADEHAKVRAENDWTAAQVARYPERLVGFCGVNPLKAYALEEIDRCARDPILRRGLKLHFGNADVRVDDAAHLERLRAVFRAANGHGMAIAVHARSRIESGRPYGPEQARVLLEELLPLAPDVPVQVAHLAGTGPGYGDAAADSAMAFLAEAVARGDPRTRRLWFDASGIVHARMSDAARARMARRIRQVGVDRVLYGSDAAVGGNLAPREAWAAFRRLPLTEAELATIAGNVAPYLR